MDKATKIIFKDKTKNISNVDVNINVNVDTNIDSIADKFVQQLNPLQVIAYEIAKSRLKSSFDIEKSIGFKSFTS